MKKTFYDEYEEREYEIDIPDELYNKAYIGQDYDALYEVGILLETKTEAGLHLVAEIMEEAYSDGEGSEEAYDWLLDYSHPDGEYDAWS